MEGRERKEEGRDLSQVLLGQKIVTKALVDIPYSPNAKIVLRTNSPKQFQKIDPGVKLNSN